MKIKWLRPSIEKTDQRSEKEKVNEPLIKKSSGLMGKLKEYTYKLNIFKIHF